MITVHSKVVVEKGCKARNITKGDVADVTAIQSLGPDYSHSVKMTLYFPKTGKSIGLYVRHENRLADARVNLNDGRPEHSVQISLATV